MSALWGPQEKMMSGPVGRAEKELLQFALGYPETHEDHPWGERVAKVGKKVFVFLHVPGDQLNVTVKLPESAAVALGLPFVAPTGYGLGKSGWVTATFPRGKRPPLDLLKRWIDESFRAVAPKKLVAALAAPPSPRATTKRRVRKK